MIVVGPPWTTSVVRGSDAKLVYRGEEWDEHTAAAGFLRVRRQRVEADGTLEETTVLRIGPGAGSNA